jgi:predicted kinase
LSGNRTTYGNIILLRGLPGSGKTELAALLSEDGKYPVYSVDSYFTDPATGEYHFNYLENHIAYSTCEQSARAALARGDEKIFIDNTFTLEWELEPYIRMASEFGYRIHIVTVENRHGGSNVHGVTDEQIKKMADKYHVVLSPESGGNNQ